MQKTLYYVNKTYLEDSQADVNYTIDSGVLDYCFHSVQLSADALSATVNVVYVVYEKRIYSTESQQFEIAVPLNQDTVNATMVRENDSWKLRSIDFMDMVSADDAINQIETSDVLPSINDFNAICEKTYPTFESALHAINSIDVKEINPF